MKKSWIFVAVVAVVIIPFILFAGKKPKEGEEESVLTIAFVPQTAAGDESSRAYYEGIKMASEKYGVELLMDDPDWDAGRQVDIIENFVAQGVDGIITEAIDSSLIVAGVERANEAGIPIIGIVNKIVGEEVLLVVMSDARQEGAIAAEKTVEELKEKYGTPKGLVLEVMGPLGSELVQDRSGGYNDVMAKYPDIEVIQKACDWELPKAESAVTDVLTANPNLDAIYAHTDYYGDAIESALTTMDRVIPEGQEGHIIWTSIDGSPRAFDKIKRGIMDSTSNAACMSFGLLAVQYLHDYITTGTVLDIGEEVKEEGATWSPGVVKKGGAGPILFLSAFLVDSETVDNPNLWGNKLK
jgi:ABC-type sugar transport system substrate-binding protein